MLTGGMLIAGNDVHGHVSHYGRFQGVILVSHAQLDSDPVGYDEPEKVRLFRLARKESAGG